MLSYFHFKNVSSAARAIVPISVPCEAWRDSHIRTTHKLYIRTQLTYGAPAWFTLFSETNYHRLHAQQSLALRTRWSPGSVRGEPKWFCETPEHQPVRRRWRHACPLPAGACALPPATAEQAWLSTRPCPCGHPLWIILNTRPSAGWRRSWGFCTYTFLDLCLICES